MKILQKLVKKTIFYHLEYFKDFDFISNINNCLMAETPYHESLLSYTKNVYTNQIVHIVSSVYLFPGKSSTFELQQ